MAAINICPLSAKDRDNPHTAAMEGGRLAAEEVEKLESTVTEDPENLTARTKLLGYYFMAGHGQAAAKERQLAHILWVVGNRPESQIAGLPFAHIHAFLNPEGYDQVKQLWIAQTEEKPDAPVIFGHAASFLTQTDPELAEKFLKRAQELEPESIRWAEALGHLHALGDGEKASGKALLEFERAQELDDDETTRFYRLGSLAKAALGAGEAKKAGRYAEELIGEAERLPKDWNHGNASHHGNMVLGHLALREGNSKLAGEFLLKAGRTKGSPQLNSFGPTMGLASALLAAGEGDTVLEYLDLCRKFWPKGGDRIDAWSKQIKAGRQPDFGTNMRY